MQGRFSNSMMRTQKEYFELVNKMETGNIIGLFFFAESIIFWKNKKKIMPYYNINKKIKVFNNDVTTVEQL